MIYEGARDFTIEFINYGFDGYEEFLAKAKETAMPKYLPCFEQVRE